MEKAINMDEEKDVRRVVDLKVRGGLPLEGGGDVLLFVHGWPDDASVWDKQVAYFSGEGRVGGEEAVKGKLCITVTLPHFAGHRHAQQHGANFWGYSFSQLADLVAAAVKRELQERGLSEGFKPPRLICVGHDWGSAVAQQLRLRHKGLVDRLVLCDVGPIEMGAPSFSELPGMIVMGLMYQWALVLAFLLSKLGGGLGRWIGDKIPRFFAKRYRAPNAKDAGSLVKVTADATYPYWYFWSNFILRLVRLRQRKADFPRPGKTPDCSCLYVFGERKPFNFHTKGWEKHLRGRADCMVVGMPVGHWVQKKSDILNAAILRFLLS